MALSDFRRSRSPPPTDPRFGAQHAHCTAHISELLLRLRAIAVLADRVKASLALTGGVHDPIDAVKAIMAGADVVQIVSALMLRGPAELKRIRDAFSTWGDRHEYDSVQEMRATLCLARSQNPRTFERGNYRQILRATVPRDFSTTGH